MDIGDRAEEGTVTGSSSCTLERNIPDHESHYIDRILKVFVCMLLVTFHVFLPSAIDLVYNRIQKVLAKDKSKSVVRAINPNTKEFVSRQASSNS